MSECLTAVYRIAKPDQATAEKVAQSLALGQTVETWTPLPGQSAEVLETHRGEVASVTPGPDGGFLASCRFPVANFEYDVPTVLTTLMGKPSFAGGVRLMDVLAEEGFLARQPGPKFGVAGIRRLVGVEDARPLAMSIFKPCLGQSVKLLSEMFAAQCRGGVNLVKDDEIVGNVTSAPTLERVRAMREISDSHFEKTGHRTLYATTLTAPVTEIVDRAVELVEAGAQMLLVNVLVYGYGVLEALARDERVAVPLMAHPALAGSMCADPERGLSYGVTLGRFMRWAGADIVLFPAQYGSHAIPSFEGEAIRNRLLEPAGSLKRAFPGPSAGVHPGMAGRILRDYGPDVIINAGGGVQGHPDGGEAGARALRQAIDWVISGRSLSEALPADHSALKVALETWGVVT